MTGRTGKGGGERNETLIFKKEKTESELQAGLAAKPKVIRVTTGKRGRVDPSRLSISDGISGLRRRHNRKGIGRRESHHGKNV